MKKLTLLTLLFIFLLVTSCSVTQQSYSYEHHVTDSLRSDSDFKYVARNVTGKAKTTIKLSAWKKMKQEMALNGLMTKAKGNLPVLKDNQAFANFSIDRLVTTSGTPTSAGINATAITIEIVISTDIIEYY
jgi:hypothetical protein